MRRERARCARRVVAGSRRRAPRARAAMASAPIAPGRNSTALAPVNATIVLSMPMSQRAAVEDQVAPHRRDRRRRGVRSSATRGRSGSPKAPRRRRRTPRAATPARPDATARAGRRSSWPPVTASLTRAARGSDQRQRPWPERAREPSRALAERRAPSRSASAGVGEVDDQRDDRPGVPWPRRSGATAPGCRASAPSP